MTIKIILDNEYYIDNIEIKKELHTASVREYYLSRLILTFSSYEGDYIDKEISIELNKSSLCMIKEAIENYLKKEKRMD